MRLDKLNDVKYFYTILDNKFDIESIVDLIPNIFKLCSGNPEQLKSLIRKLYLRDGINLPVQKTQRAQINLHQLKKILLEGTFDLTYNDFTEDEQFVLIILLGFYGTVDLNVFQNCILYVHSKLFGGNIWSQFIVNRIIQNLINKNILIKEGKVQKEIKFVHDKTSLGIQILFADDINKPLISHHIYQYLSDNQSIVLIRDIGYLRAQHAYIAQELFWIKENYDYAYQQFMQKKFFDALPIFKRITKESVSLKFNQWLVIAETYYETGDYYNAKKILQNHTLCSENKNESFRYYFLFGKIENILLNKTEAITYYDMALKNTSDREKEILILHLKHLALLETTAGKQMAAEIFNSIALHLSEKEKEMLPVCYLLRNCNQFYTGDTAKKFFDLALKIATNKGSLIDEAYVHNNYGLELFRTNQQDSAYTKFETAYQILLDNKYHEAAYPLNNMAVCEMFKGNYSQAVEYLTEAKYLNQSLYASLAIKVHLMTCYRILGEEVICRQYMYQLEDYLEKKQIFDTNIIRKLSINLCISHLYYGEEILARACLKRCLKYITGTISEYRGCQLNNKLNEKKLDYSKAMQSNIYYKKLEFEPWIITLSHD